MATRSAFNDDSYQMYRMDDVLDSVNLNVIGWNRATVADGQWLQDNAIGPLSARDMYLADCIDEAWGSINDIRQTLADMGAETTGVNLVGFTMKSLNVAQCNDPEAAYLPGNLSWAAKETPLVTTGAGDTFITPASLSYLTFGNQAKHIGEEVAGTLAASEIGGILQMNTTAHDAYQMAFTPSGIYYRHISNSDGTPQTQTGERGNFTYMDHPADFSALPLGAMTEAQINTKLQAYQTVNAMSNYYTKSETSAASDINTALGQKANTTDLNNYQSKCSNSDDKYYGVKNGSWAEIPAGITYTTGNGINIDASTHAISVDTTKVVTDTTSADAYTGKHIAITVTEAGDETPIPTGNYSVDELLKKLVEIINATTSGTDINSYGIDEN